MKAGKNYSKKESTIEEVALEFATAKADG